MSNTPPPMGHNNPPPYDAIAHAASVSKAQEVADAAASWMALGEIETEEQSQMLTDFVAATRKIEKAIDAERAEAKKPHDLAGKAVQKAYETPLSILDKCLAKAKLLQSGWLIKEQKRIAAEKARLAEEAAQKRAEAEAEAQRAALNNDIAGQVAAEEAEKEAAALEKAANRKETAKAGSYTGGGRTMALRTVKTAVIVSRRQVLMHYQDHPDVVDVLQRLANAAVRAGETVPGVEVDEKQVAA